MKALKRIVASLRQSRQEDELREEMEAHRAMLQARLEADGLQTSEAAAASRRSMGNTLLAREESRDVWVVAALDRLRRDLRYGARALRREPAFAAIAILTLALGVATTTTVFSVVDAELWKPLPYPEPAQLVSVTVRGPGGRGPTESIAGADLLDWAGQTQTVSSIVGLGDTRRRVLRRATAEPVLTEAVTWNYFDVVGLEAISGRTFAESDAQGGVILTERGWRRLFEGSPGVVGAAISLDGEQRRIVGIVTTDDSLGPAPDMFLALDHRSSEFMNREARPLNRAIARLRPGVEAASAQAELQGIARRIADAYPEGRKDRTVQVEGLQAFHTTHNWRSLYFFLATSLVVLVLACVNVASLLLARAMRRRREFSVRAALGGGTPALMHQLLVEGGLLALPASVVGLLLTHWALRALTTQLPPEYLLRGTVIPLDARVLAFAMLATTVTAAVFAMAPWLMGRRVGLNLALSDGGRTAGESPGRATARQVLLVSQIAMTLVLLVAAGLFVRSYVLLLNMPLGFEPEGRVSVRLTGAGPKYATDAQMVGFSDRILERARAVPGVSDAAVATSSPLTSGPVVRFTGGSQAQAAAGEEPRAILRSTTPGFFDVLGIPLVEGRDFKPLDSSGAPRVAVINAVLAGRLFAGESPIGRTLTLIPGARAAWTRRPGELTIVGVVANVKEVGLNEVDFNDIYVPFAQAPSSGIEVLVRSGVPPASIAGPLRAAAGGVDPDVPVTSVTLLDTRVADAFREDRFHLLLIGCFAIVGLTLAGIGIYGAVSYAVQRRRREFGVRLALGARPRTLVFAALREALRVAALGGALGLAGALVIARLLGNALYLVPGEHNGLLYGVTTTDPLVLVSATLGLLALALCASAIPARSLARLDPLVALRVD